MKRILIPSILVATILVGVGLAFAIWKAVPQSSQDLYNSGKKYYDQRKFDEATIQFQNSIQKDPKNRDARYYLALSYLEQSKLNEAAKQLNSLLEFYPDDIQAQIPLGNIFLVAGPTDPKYFREAAALAQKILAKDPKNVAGFVLAGNAAAGLQDYRSSVDQFDKAIELDPKNIAAFVSLGTSQALQKNNKEAEDAFLKARQINPKDKNALMSLGNFYRVVTKETEKAEAIYKEALSIYPTDQDVYKPIVQHFYLSNRFEEVEKILHNVQSANKADPSPSIMLADLYTSVNRAADARTLLFELKKSYPTDRTVSGKIAALLLGTEPDRARIEIDEILKADPKSPMGLLLLGELQFNTGQYDLATASLEKEPQVTATFPQANFILGEISLKKGQLDEAQLHFQKAIDVSSNYLPARVGLAEVLLNKMRLADARQEVNKILKAQPGFIPALLLKANIDAVEKKYPEADQGFADLAKAQPNNGLILMQYGIYLDSRGRTAEAEKSMLRALEIQPESREFLQGLTTFYIRTKQVDKAIQKIKAIPDEKKQAFHYEMLGAVYVQAGKLQDSEEAFKKAIEKDPSGTNAQGLLASLYIQTRRFDEGMKQIEDLLKKNPNNGGAIAVKGMIYETQGKVDEAKQAYKQALSADPNNDTAANNLAFILAEQGEDLNTAKSWAQMARRKQPENPNTADTLGWVEYKLGNTLLARDQLLFAVGKQPDSGVFQYHLGMIYKQNKQNAEAQAALKKAADNPKEFKEKSLAQAALKEIASLK